MGASSAGVGPELALTVMQSMADAVLVVAADGTIEAASDACRTLFGWEPDELVGRSVDELIPDDRRVAHRHHRERYANEPVSRPMGVGLRLRAACRDGSQRDIDVALTPFDDQGRVLAVVRDESAQAAMRAQKDLVQRMLDAMTEGVFMFHPESLVLTYVNDGAVRQTGYSRDELIGGMTPLDVMADGDQTSYREMLRPLLHGGVDAIEFETVHRRKDGTLVPVDVLLQWPEVDAVASDVPLVALSRDVSERRAAEAARERQHQWLESLSDTRLALLAGVPADDILALVCAHVRTLTGATSAFVLEAAPDGNGLVVGCTCSPDETFPSLRLRADGAIASKAAGVVARAASLGAGELQGADAAVARHFGVSEMLLAPLRLGIESDGVLVVGRPEGAAPWSVTDAELLSSYALEAATALELARARVETQRLITLEDRERIAADLHDMVIQRLFAAGMRLQGMVPLIENAAVTYRVQEVVDDLDATIGEIRQAIFGLHRPDVEPPSLETTLRDVIAGNAAYLGFVPTLRIEGDLAAVPSRASDQLIPVITEALSNVARHAAADCVEVDIVASADGIALTVTDNGRGIQPTDTPGNGLANLARRARSLGGRFHTGPGASGTGTTLHWAVGSDRPDPSTELSAR